MEEFLRSIPAAATNPYAFAAYAIAALVFMFAGAKLKMAKLLLQKINSIPEADRRRALEIATGTVLPVTISPEQWIRNNRQRSTFLIIGALLISIIAVVTIAILNPTKADIRQIENKIESSARGTEGTIAEGNKSVIATIQESKKEIVNEVQDAALAQLETMFPLAVRVERDVDSTIMNLSGKGVQRLISYDKDYAPMNLRWGDRFVYYAYRPGGGAIDQSAKVLLSVRSANFSESLPLPLGTLAERTIRIPGKSPAPMEANFINPDGISGVAIKITIYSSDRERGREEFKRALQNTVLNSAARRIYLSVTVDGVRLRNEPSPSGRALRTIQEGTYVKVKSRSDGDQWTQVLLPEGREGWIKSEYLKPLVP